MRGSIVLQDHGWDIFLIWRPLFVIFLGRSFIHGCLLLSLLYNGHMDKKELIQHCKAFEQGYTSIALLMYEWAKKNKAFKKTWEALLEQEAGSTQPSGYYEASALNYLLSNILTDTKLLKQFQDEHELFMVPRDKQVLSHWLMHPAYWSFFSVTEILDDTLSDDNFFTIEDHLTGETHKLYSNRLLDLIEDPRLRDKHFLTLVYSDGECLHTAGILRFNSLSASDLHFYCNLFDDRACVGIGLKDVINKYYLQFFKLDTIAFVPEQEEGKHKLGQTWQPFTLESFDISRLGGTWETVKIGSQIKYNLIQPDESMRSLPDGELLFSDFLMMEGLLVRDKVTGAMALSTGNTGAYTLHRALLTRFYPNLLLPGEPSVSISLPLAILLMEMDITVPWSHFKKILFTPPPSSKDLLNDKNSEQEALQAKQKEEDIEDLLYVEYKQAKADGIPFDREEFSSRTGASPEKVASFILEMDPYTVPSEDKAFELPGWPAPPQALKRFFHEPLETSKLFVFDEGPNTLVTFNVLTAGQYNNDYRAMGLVGFIEKLFTDFFDDKTLSYLIANYFFWILFHTGKDWAPVRSYAIEMLKIIPSFILMNYYTAEDFISDFSLFTKRRLTKRGICSLKARPKQDEVTTGLYLIKGSDAFYSLVEGVNIQ